ncbi:MAG: hypothetical protein ACLSVD_16045 [Eggerthellaceae bacterium]
MAGDGTSSNRFAAYEHGQPDQKLLARAEAHFELADTTVYLAQRRAESVPKIAGIGIAIIVSASCSSSCLNAIIAEDARSAHHSPLTRGRNPPHSRKRRASSCGREARTRSS